MAADVSVVLICATPEHVVGAGCCGSITQYAFSSGERKSMPGRNRQQLDVGVLHRAVRQFFSTSVDERKRVDVVVVDPRNQLYLAPKLMRDVLRYRPGWRAGLRTLFQHFPLPAAVVNGTVVCSPRRLPDPDQLCHVVAERLASPKCPVSAG